MPWEMSPPKALLGLPPPAAPRAQGTGPPGDGGRQQRRCWRVPPPSHLPGSRKRGGKAPPRPADARSWVRAPTHVARLPHSAVGGLNGAERALAGPSESALRDSDGPFAGPTATGGGSAHRAVIAAGTRAAAARRLPLPLVEEASRRPADSGPVVAGRAAAALACGEPGGQIVVWYLSQCWGYRILLFGVSPQVWRAVSLRATVSRVPAGLTRMTRTKDPTLTSSPARPASETPLACRGDWAPVARTRTRQSRVARRDTVTPPWRRDTAVAP
jgi:hypothetical protein